MKNKNIGLELYTNTDVDNRIEIYQKAMEKFGIKNQVLMLAEEQGELFKACNKMVRFAEQFDHSDESDRLTEYRLSENIVEEIADNIIMIEQMILYFGISKDYIEEVKQFKINRLENLVNSYTQKDEISVDDCK